MAARRYQVVDARTGPAHAAIYVRRDKAQMTYLYQDRYHHSICFPDYEADNAYILILDTPLPYQFDGTAHDALVVRGATTAL